MLAQLQVDPKKYSSISKGFSTIIKEQGARGLLKGWAPTLVGYSFQGACKFGFYEYFKKYANRWARSVEASVQGLTVRRLLAPFQVVC